MTPFVADLPKMWTPAVVFERLAARPGTIFFDSARPGKLGRYSFLAHNPFESFVLEQATHGTDPFANVRTLLGEWHRETIPELPPFQGGAAGVLNYELGRCWEVLPPPMFDEFQLPACVIHIYSSVFTWDHQQQRGWWISHDSAASQLWSDLRSSFDNASVTDATNQKFKNIDAAAPLFDVPREGISLQSNFTEQGYLDAVQRVIEYIRAGDIFQANLSQRLSLPATRSSVEQYLRLRETNPAPFAGYFAHEDWVVMSSSPERFVEVHQGTVSTRPIKGTRKRANNPQANLYTRDELRESEKDQAENVMIVDLLRNDLSRVCQPGTIRVPELCAIEEYETVTHLVSEVTGKLKDDHTFWELVAATFPGGSITGAPKIRAMEIITELEQVARGPYCGSLFYCGFDGTADSNILIRTMTQRHGTLHIPVGGGVVAQSIPAREYEETWHKAQGMLRALK